MSVKIGFKMILVDLARMHVEHASGLHLDSFEIDIVDAVPTAAHDQLMEIVAMATPQDVRIRPLADLGTPNDFHREQRVGSRLEPNVRRTMYFAGMRVDSHP